MDVKKPVTLTWFDSDMHEFDAGRAGVRELTFDTVPEARKWWEDDLDSRFGNYHANERKLEDGRREITCGSGYTRGFLKVDYTLDDPLSAAQLEASAHLIEECAESIQVLTKMQRFGIRVNPWDGEHNADHLTTELGQVLAAMQLATKYGLVDPKKVQAAKDERIQHWLSPGKLKHCTSPVPFTITKKGGEAPLVVDMETTGLRPGALPPTPPGGWPTPVMSTENHDAGDEAGAR